MYKEQELFIFISNIYIYTFFLRYPTPTNKFQLYYFYHNRDKILSYLHAA